MKEAAALSGQFLDPLQLRSLLLGGPAAGLAAAEAAGIGLYIDVIRPWHLHWQTMPGEASEPMPGDELVTSPTIELTRGVTIEAPPANVWPWLVQMGCRRAGWYSYDLFDNDGVHVHEILPEFQELKVGDVMRKMLLGIKERAEAAYQLEGRARNAAQTEC